MAEKFGREYTEKLVSRGFRSGRILDTGCGFGAMDIVLAYRFVDSEIVGIDLSDPLLRLANRSAQAASLGNRVRFEKADVHQIPYDDDVFDVVINTNMVHLVDDAVQMLDEIERVLAPDGCLFIADIRRSWIGLLDKTFRSALTLDEARELVYRSSLREGSFSSSLLWWRLEA
jgi:ubiquinone/menaquinone biosynthesis C-methylase UbiE